MHKIRHFVSSSQLLAGGTNTDTSSTYVPDEGEYSFFFVDQTISCD